MFRRDFFRYYEHEVFPATLAQSMAAHAQRGHADLIELGYGITMNLTADFAGVDRPRGDADETSRLRSLTGTFSEGATLVHSTRDKELVRSEVRAALAEFESTFYRGSMTRRRDLLTRFAAGEVPEDALPRDVLTVLLRNEDKVEIAPDLMLREYVRVLLWQGLVLHGHFHQVSNGTRLHLLHHVGPMNFDRFRAQSEAIGDRLVRLSFHHQVQHFALTRRQAGKERTQLRSVHIMATLHGVEGNRLMDSFEQVLVVERLLDKVERASLYRPHRHLNVAMAGDEDDRQMNPLCLQALLEIQAAHTWHAYIQNQATRFR